uniref:uncharacterized protein n=1 Tax=Lonchura striata TaxID=40157 RepID=UPI001293F7B0|nr:uncharacterized protein LOC110481696 [Lonchura striata domestica]
MYHSISSGEVGADRVRELGEKRVWSEWYSQGRPVAGRRGGVPVPLVHAQTGARRGSLLEGAGPGGPERAGPGRPVLGCRSGCAGTCFAQGGLLNSFYLPWSLPARCAGAGSAVRALELSPETGRLRGAPVRCRVRTGTCSLWAPLGRRSREPRGRRLAFCLLSYPIDVRPRFPQPEIKPCTCLTYSGLCSPVVNTASCVRTRSCGLPALGPFSGTCKSVCGCRPPCVLNSTQACPWTKLSEDKADLLRQPRKASGLQIVPDMFILFLEDWSAQKTQALGLLLLSCLSKHEILLMKENYTSFIPVKSFHF